MAHPVADNSHPPALLGPDYTGTSPRQYHPPMAVVKINAIEVAPERGETPAEGSSLLELEVVQEVVTRAGD